MNTYNKLGGKTLAELPIPPTGLNASNDSTTAISVTWDNNNTITGGTNVIQVWDETSQSWINNGSYASGATSGVTTGTSVVATYNVRVAVLLDGRYYPSLVTTGTIIDNPYPLSGLVARWEFEDDLTDDSGNDYNLTASATAEYETGLVGKCQYVSNQSLYTTDTDLIGVFSGTSNFTVSAWYNMADNYNTLMSCRSNYSGGIGTSNYVGGIVASGGNTYMYARQKSSNNLGELTTNTWYHIVFQFDGTATKCYINNVYKGQIIDNTSITPEPYFRLIAGTYGVKVDQSYLYNRALSEAEIAKLYNDGDGI